MESFINSDKRKGKNRKKQSHKKRKRENQKWCHDWCTNHDDEEMIGCDSKQCVIEWYHLACVGMESGRIPDGAWYCSTCQARKKEIEMWNQHESEPYRQHEFPQRRFPAAPAIADSSPLELDHRCSVPEVVFLCPVCQRSFSDKQECKRHQQQCIRKQDTRRRTETIEIEESDESTPHRSPHTPGPTPSPAASDTAPSQSQEADSKVTPLARFSDRDLIDKLVARKEVWECVCGIIFTDQTLYFIHRGCHNTQNAKTCSFCQFEASNWYEFMSHFMEHKITS